MGGGEKGKEKDSGYLLLIVTLKTYLKEECNELGFNTLLVLFCFYTTYIQDVAKLLMGTLDR